jgi:hypothetical protein
MTLRQALAALTVIASLATPSAAAPNRTLNDSGNAFLEQCKSPASTTDRLICLAYVRGLVEGIDISQFVSSGGQSVSSQRRICTPDTAEAQQLLDVITAHLVRNPTNRHVPTRVIAYGALRQAYPCRGSSK